MDEIGAYVARELYDRYGVEVFHAGPQIVWDDGPSLGDVEDLLVELGYTRIEILDRYSAIIGRMGDQFVMATRRLSSRTVILLLLEAMRSGLDLGTAEEELYDEESELSGVTYEWLYEIRVPPTGLDPADPVEAVALTLVSDTYRDNALSLEQTVVGILGTVNALGGRNLLTTAARLAS